MSAVKCIVINGWHKGHMITLPQALPIIKLPRPKVVTVCDCSDLYGEERFIAVPKIDTYMLAFGAVDGKGAIYTVKGDSEPMFSNRDWHTYSNRSPWKDTPLIVGCHDDRAVFESSLEASESELLAGQQTTSKGED